MSVSILEGDCRELLSGLPDHHFHCCITSPPYWGVRDYKLPPTVWGGDSNCEHVWQDTVVERHMRRGLGLSPASTRGGGKKIAKVGWQRYMHGTCARCGAWLGCLGLEPDPRMYVQHIVECLRHVWRVLRNDGVLWLNMGDCYITKPIGSGSTFDPKWPSGRNRAEGLSANRTNSPGSIGLKHKDQAGIPWRVYFALQEDGWYGRRDVVWFKTNAMPESVGDRPPTAHEYIFLLTKRAKYFYDRLGATETVTEGERKRAGDKKAKLAGKNSRVFRLHDPEHVGRASRQGACPSGAVSVSGQQRTKRSVWSIATAPYREAHFATFPPKLVEPCILLGTSAYGSCPTCGAPWVRVVKRKFYGDWSMSKALKAAGINRQKRNGKWTSAVDSDTAPAAGDHSAAVKMRMATRDARKAGGEHDNPFEPARTVGWRPSCKCYDHLYRELPRSRSREKSYRQDLIGSWWARARKRPGNGIWPAVDCRVLDPFSGSGTVGAVAKQLHRDAVLVEAKPQYVELAQRRVANAKPRPQKLIDEDNGAGPSPKVSRQGVLLFLEESQ